MEVSKNIFPSKHIVKTAVAKRIKMKSKQKAMINLLETGIKGMKSMEIEQTC